MPCLKGFRRIVNQAKVDNLDSLPCEFFLDLLQILFQPKFQTFELRPIGIKPDSKTMLDTFS